ncbi:S-adenosylmethionine:tRNA ribosyltransferase-isomerase, partial [Thiolapillus sp.]
MRTSDFSYDLPRELIAQYPAQRRTGSRLLVVDQDRGLSNRQFGDFPLLLRENDLLVFNDTRVMAARLYGHKETGGKVEILLERLLQENRALAQIRASKSPKAGSRILVGDAGLVVEGREG